MKFISQAEMHKNLQIGDLIRYGKGRPEIIYKIYKFTEYNNKHKYFTIFIPSFLIDHFVSNHFLEITKLN